MVIVDHNNISKIRRNKGKAIFSSTNFGGKNTRFVLRVIKGIYNSPARRALVWTLSMMPID